MRNSRRACRRVRARRLDALRWLRPRQPGPAEPAEVIIHGALGQHERARNLALAAALVEREAEGLEHLSHGKSLCGHTLWMELLEE